MRRIAVIGSGGAGKSTLARRLGEILDIEVIHLDALYWNPGWVETPKQQWRETVEELIARDKWIMDGNYGATFDVRLPAADTIVFLDFPTRVCLWRAIKRRIQYHGKCRPDMAEGCPEQIDWEFLMWIWRFRKNIRPTVLQRIEDFGRHARLVHLRSPREANVWIEGIRASCDVQGPPALQ